MKKIILLFVFLVPFTLMCQNEYSRKDLYGTIDPEVYVSGRFNPASSPLFGSLNKAQIRSDEKTHFLRKEAIAALERMSSAFEKANPGLKIRVISSTRNFSSQKSIWESKWNGSRKVDGLNLNTLKLPPLEKGLKILRYSSMPGTSRHHWGTDFDINSLENSYFEKGEGLALYEWLLENAADYGFYQPYTAGRKEGYEEEKWHWSYLPLSKHFYEDWMNFYRADSRFIIDAEKFSGCEDLYHLSSVYVSSINPECF